MSDEPFALDDDPPPSPEVERRRAPLFTVLSISEQLAAFDQASAPTATPSAQRQRLRRSIERGWTIFDPIHNKLRLTDAGRAAIREAEDAVFAERGVRRLGDAEAIDV